MHAANAPLTLLGALALIVAASPHRVLAQEDSASVAQMCVNRLGIDHTKVLDDRNILFFMHNHTKYRNTLLGTCPGLRAEDHFAYAQDMGNNLCKGNVIRVLSYSFGSASLGASCWLGMFEPLSDDEVEELLTAASPKGKSRNVSRQAVKVEPVELPPAAQAQPARPETAAPAANTAEPAPAGEGAR
jgi:hypothetical protein